MSKDCGNFDIDWGYDLVSIFKLYAIVNPERK